MTVSKNKKMKCNINRKNKDDENRGDPRLKEIVQNLDSLKIGSDEPFRFHCIMCGKCCVHREDIMLTPKDLLGIAKELGMNPDEIVRTYCDTDIGDTSRFLIVRLHPTGYDKHCPLLKDNLCSVHSVKPVVCAMFPIGRVLSASGDEMKAEDITPDTVQYIFVKPGCGDGSETHTVREWFGEFGIPMEDEFFVSWQRTLNAVSAAIRRLESKMDSELMKTVWNVVFVMIYLNYDPEQDFFDQFSANSKRITEHMKKVEEVINQS